MAKFKSSLFVLYKRMILAKREQKNGQFSETGNIAYTRRIQWKQKHNTICVGHHCAQAKTDNGNKTQTTGGKDEPNIVFIRTSQRTSRHGTHEGLKVQSSPIKVLVLIEERKHLRKNYKLYCHLRYGYFITVIRIVITTLEYLKW
jgi:hypothetical protein